jgi:hypothetical protein
MTCHVSAPRNASVIRQGKSKPVSPTINPAFEDWLASRLANCWGRCEIIYVPGLNKYICELWGGTISIPLSKPIDRNLLESAVRDEQHKWSPRNGPHTGHDLAFFMAGVLDRLDEPWPPSLRSYILESGHPIRQARETGPNPLANAGRDLIIHFAVNHVCRIAGLRRSRNKAARNKDAAWPSGCSVVSRVLSSRLGSPMSEDGVKAAYDRAAVNIKKAHDEAAAYYKRHGMPDQP